MLAGHDEAAAYIADALYGLATKKYFPIGSDAIEQHALAVAPRLRAAGTAARRLAPAHVPSLLYRAIARHPAYGRGVFTTYSVADG